MIYINNRQGELIDILAKTKTLLNVADGRGEHAEGFPHLRLQSDRVIGHYSSLVFFSANLFEALSLKNARYDC